MQEETTHPSSTTYPIKSENHAERLLVCNTTHGIFLLAIADMLYARAEGTFTTLFMHDGRQHILPRSLKECLQMFSTYGFVKVNRTCLVNQRWVSRLLPGENVMELKSGQSIVMNSYFAKHLLDRWKGI